MSEFDQLKKQKDAILAKDNELIELLRKIYSKLESDFELRKMMLDALDKHHRLSLAAIIASGAFLDWTPGKIIHEDTLAADALAVADELLAGPKVVGRKTE